MGESKIEILYGLGDKTAWKKDWPNYLAYGFTQDDVPGLLNVIMDDFLNDAQNGSSEVWAPMHAWRVLGQLKSEQAVLPLLNLFDELSEDDCALNELPTVLGMIGEATITPLSTYMNDARHQEFARVMATDGLGKVVEHYPETRDQVLGHFQAYLAEPDTSLSTFNGLLVCHLLDLEAKELIEPIRALFNRQCVDISCAGDLQEVEIIMGFRSERTIPKPTPFEMSGISPGADADNHFEQIDFYLDRYGNDKSIHSVSGLDGLFAALGCSPRNIMPTSWMSAIWGDEALAPEWQSKEEIDEFSSAVFGLYNSVMGEMNEDIYQTLYLIREVEGETHTMVDEWCNGFLRGVNLWGRIPSADAVVLEKVLEPVRLFATERGFEQLKGLTDAQIAQHQAAIEPGIRELFLHFYKQRMAEVEPVTRDTAKVGRNDLCPCGSGKKYKKCCLH